MAVQKGEVAVITGASSGIGRATAREFARQGYSLALIARRTELLETLVSELSKETPQGVFVAIPCDISRWTDVARAAEKVGERFGAVNVLVNNAGAFEYLSLEKSTPEKLDQMIDVNVRGVVYVTKAFLPWLKNAVQQGQRAKIVNVSSVGGLWGFSNMSVYTATKFAVTGFSSALRRELAAEKIQVATIYPGPVNTRVAPGTVPPKKGLTMLPEQIARQIHRLAASEKNYLVSHPAFSILTALEFLSPRMVDKLFKKITS
jgi:short-subunit dehydrogenase